MPDDHTGPVRIVSIEGVDANMCCGTHVSNLSDLQVRHEMEATADRIPSGCPALCPILTHAFP